MPSDQPENPTPPRPRRLRKTLRLIAIIAISFIAGVFVAKTIDRPVAGTFRQVVPPDLMAKLEQPKGIHIEQMPLDQALPFISKTYGVNVRLYEHTVKELNIDADRLISISVPGATLLQTLLALQNDYDLYATVDAHGTGIVLGSREQIDPLKFMRIYDIGPIMSRLTGTTESEDNPRLEVERIVLSGSPEPDPSDVEFDADDQVMLVRSSAIGHELVARRLNEFAKLLEKRQ